MKLHFFDATVMSVSDDDDDARRFNFDLWDPTTRPVVDNPKTKPFDIWFMYQERTEHFQTTEKILLKNKK